MVACCAIPAAKRPPVVVGLRGGDGTPDDAPAPAPRTGDGHIMPDGWRRLAQWSGARRKDWSPDAREPADAGRTPAAAKPRSPMVLGDRRRASDSACPRAGRTIRPPGIYVVRSGDNLWAISRRHYKRGRYWSVIYRANDDKISNPDLIFPCQRFRIPRLSRLR